MCRFSLTPENSRESSARFARVDDVGSDSGKVSKDTILKGPVAQLFLAANGVCGTYSDASGCLIAPLSEFNNIRFHSVFRPDVETCAFRNFRNLLGR